MLSCFINLQILINNNITIDLKIICVDYVNNQLYKVNEVQLVIRHKYILNSLVANNL